MHRFLLISNQYFPNVVGGAELSVQTLAEELTRRGHRVCVVSLSRTDRESVDEVNGIRVHRLAIRNVYPPFAARQQPLMRAAWHLRDMYNVAMAKKVGQILDEERPDWVSAHNLAGFSVAIWAEVKKRRVGLSQVLHDYYAICPRSTMNHRGANCDTPCVSCRFFSAPKKAVSHTPDVVIGVSRFVLQKHLALGFFAHCRSGVVYNGRELDPAQEPRLKEPGSPLDLGYIGRIEPLKGIETLLKAVSRLPKGRWRLRVAGRAPDAAFLQHLQQRYPLPEVEYLGFVKPEQLYGQSDVVVVPSEWQEPFGNVVFEPLGFGVPVIASNIGGIPEILEGANCGWLFEPGHVNQLASLLHLTLDGVPDLEGMRSRALQRRAFFTPSRQADDFLRLTLN